MKSGITGLVLTYNGERLLDKCLASLAFCDRVLVVDSFSSDSTVAIAAKYGADILQNAWKGPAAQFIYAFKQINTEWVVSLDQDEICTDELRDAILKATAAAPAEQAGFYTRRRNWYYDRFMKHSGWYPDRLLRVFRPELMKVEVSGAHYSFHPQGPTQNIEADILHYPYESFSQHLDKINSYAQQGAEDLRRKGTKGGILAGMGHGFARFMKLYLFQKGFLDGRAGFINATHGAFYAYLKYLRVEEGNWGAPYDKR
ncbi:glycosyltransferase family 2 protein [Oleidesulfovibrio sp.]|uniref:glycosyltransferase family 2 protein n=1 Tax=Oleidesulfovibrio sp. TaxID=2909707 RepID=UPI003A84FA33